MSYGNGMTCLRKNSFLGLMFSAKHHVHDCWFAADYLYVCLLLFKACPFTVRARIMPKPSLNLPTLVGVMSEPTT